MTELEKQRPRLKKKILTTKQLKKHNFSSGQIGENQAVSFLQNKGYTIVEKNTRFKKHEVDIICIDTQNQELVFVEVKYRWSSNFGNPAQAVNYKKLQSIYTVAHQFIQETNWTKNFRFDVIAIQGTQIQHFINISW